MARSEWRGRETRRAARRQENIQEVKSISLPNMRATAWSKPISWATRMEWRVSLGRRPSTWTANTAQV